MTCPLGQWDGVPDPEDGEAVWAAVMREREQTFRRLVGAELDDWATERVKDA